MTALRTLILFLSVTTTLGVGALALSPADASTPRPRNGDRIAVVLVSDVESNTGVTWFDAENRMRSQTDVPLPIHDTATRRWRGTMVYTTRVRHQRVDVLFQSAGSFAACEIWVNDRKAVARTAHGRHATAFCH